MNSSGKYRISHKNYKLLLPRVARATTGCVFSLAKLHKRRYNTVRIIKLRAEEEKEGILKIAAAGRPAISRKGSFATDNTMDEKIYRERTERRTERRPSDGDGEKKGAGFERGELVNWKGKVADETRRPDNRDCARGDGRIRAQKTKKTGRSIYSIGQKYITLFF